MFRSLRYERLRDVIAPVVTQASQQRVDKTLQDAYAKASAQGATLEELKGFDQKVIDRANEVLAKENAVRIRQWTQAVLDEEDRGRTCELSQVDSLCLLALGFMVAIVCLRR